MDLASWRSGSVSPVLAQSEPPDVPVGAEPESFEDLYRRLLPRVYAYVASLLRDRTGAEDVTALAFERAYRRRTSYRPSRGTAEAWLFGIARNAALDELRRRGRRATLDADPEELAPAAEERLELSLRRATVRSALRDLGTRERELLALKFGGGLSNAEVSRVLGISESNAGTLLHRVVEKLRKACNEQG